MEDIKIDNFLPRLKDLEKAFSIPESQERLSVLKEKMEDPEFWQDQKEAAKILQSAKALQDKIGSWYELSGHFSRLREMEDMVKSDPSWQEEFAKEAERFIALLEETEDKIFLSGEYDAKNCLLTISAGTGGVDAQDFAQMLERMMLRYCERKGFRAEIEERIVAQEAGIKSVMIKVSGVYAYGHLKCFNGVHRLERHSPFNAQGKEQTSFASIEAVPEIEAEEIDIKDEDVRIDVFRSSGPGGQSVNTTDSAVRLVHIPTGITVSCQTERSQHQNKENAFALLRAKLAQLELERQQDENFRLKGGVNRAEWASHIISYSLSKLKKVKDRRTGYESNDPYAVLDGDLDGFAQACLRFSA